MPTSSAGVALSRSGPAKPRRPLKRSVLVEDNARRDQRVAQGRKSASCAFFFRYSARFSIGAPHTSMCAG